MLQRCFMLAKLPLKTHVDSTHLFPRELPTRIPLFRRQPASIALIRV